MKKNKTKYTDEPMNVGKKVRDFLPSPEQLVLTKKTSKITLNIDTPVVEYFKHEANKHNGHYQSMMNAVLKNYMDHQGGLTGS
ncbi:MAG: BrnA antitoxin family protein [Candidatus Protochlamydia sp.]|nr:BrnA antitoxin family protein [Candidatus Protochlamydia sp.]